MGRISFGYILRRLRKEREETLEQVSDATGLSVAMLSRIERGERLPSPESVEALAKHFELPVDYLMSETIANRMVSRYGEKRTSRAAEHLSREPLDLALFYADSDSDEGAAGEAGDAAAGAASSRQPRRYGLFREMDIRHALGSAEPSARYAPIEDEVRAVAPPAPYPPTEPEIVAEMAPAASATGPSRSEMDHATERVLRAASDASEAAAVLIMREAPSLSREARLELIQRITTLAARAVDVLQILASDPDSGVRAAARDALRKLIR